MTTSNMAGCFAREGKWDGAVLLYHGVIATMEQVGDQLSPRFYRGQPRQHLHR